MDDYHILHLIGEGCFGKVFKGRKKHSGKIVALKFITKRGKSDKDLTNLRSEISILRKLNHDHIILMYDYFETSSDFCVVTEYAHGELFEIFQDDKYLPEPEVQGIARQLIKALHYLHDNRIIHRDMKPQNILIGANNTVKLCDFGFARAMSTNTVVLTSIKGTPLYMAPELVQERPYNHTADLWSLGVILYELVIGQPPFYTNSLYSLIQLIVKEPVKYPAGVGEDFKSFLQGLLQKDPNQRMGWPDLFFHPWIRHPSCDPKTNVKHGLNQPPLEDMLENQITSGTSKGLSKSEQRLCALCAPFLNCFTTTSATPSMPQDLKFVDAIEALFDAFRKHFEEPKDRPREFANLRVASSSSEVKSDGKTSGTTNGLPTLSQAVFTVGQFLNRVGVAAAGSSNSSRPSREQLALLRRLQESQKWLQYALLCVGNLAGSNPDVMGDLLRVLGLWLRAYFNSNDTSGFGQQGFVSIFLRTAVPFPRITTNSQKEHEQYVVAQINYLRCFGMVFHHLCVHALSNGSSSSTASGSNSGLGKENRNFNGNSSGGSAPHFGKESGSSNSSRRDMNRDRDQYGNCSAQLSLLERIADGQEEVVCLETVGQGLRAQSGKVQLTALQTLSALLHNGGAGGGSSSTGSPLSSPSKSARGGQMYGVDLFPWSNIKGNIAREHMHDYLKYVATVPEQPSHIFPKLLSTVWRCLDNNSRKMGSGTSSGRWIPHLWELHSRMAYEGGPPMFEPICFRVLACFARAGQRAGFAQRICQEPGVTSMFTFHSLPDMKIPRHHLRAGILFDINSPQQDYANTCVVMSAMSVLLRASTGICVPHLMPLAVQQQNTRPLVGWATWENLDAFCTVFGRYATHHYMQNASTPQKQMRGADGQVYRPPTVVQIFCCYAANAIASLADACRFGEPFRDPNQTANIIAPIHSIIWELFCSALDCNLAARQLDDLQRIEGQWGPGGYGVTGLLDGVLGLLVHSTWSTGGASSRDLALRCVRAIIATKTNIFALLSATGVLRLADLLVHYQKHLEISESLLSLLLRLFAAIPSLNMVDSFEVSLLPYIQQGRPKVPGMDSSGYFYFLTDYKFSHANHHSLINTLRFAGFLIRFRRHLRLCYKIKQVSLDRSGGVFVWTGCRSHHANDPPYVSVRFSKFTEFSESVRKS